MSARGGGRRRRRGFDRDVILRLHLVHDSVLVHLFGGFRAERSGANRGTESATETCDVDAARADGCLGDWRVGRVLVLLEVVFVGRRRGVAV